MFSDFNTSLFPESLMMVYLTLCLYLSACYCLETVALFSLLLRQEVRMLVWVAVVLDQYNFFVLNAARNVLISFTCAG